MTISSRSLPSHSDEISRFLFETPGKIALLIFFVSALLSMALAEFAMLSIWILTLFFITYRRFKGLNTSIFRLGGDLFIFLFVASIAMSLYQTNTDQSTSLIMEFALKSSWVFSLYCLTYSFEFFPSLNKRVLLLIFVAVVTGLTGILQSITGLSLNDPTVPLPVLLDSPIKELSLFKAQGLTNSPEIFSYQMAMILGFPMAALTVHQRINKRIRISATLAVAILIVATLLTYEINSYVALAIPIFLVFFLRRQNLKLMLTAIICFSFYVLLPKISLFAPLQVDPSSKKEQIKRELLQVNVAMFKAQPFFGWGFERNFLSYDRFLSSKERSKVADSETPLPTSLKMSLPQVPAPNTYIQLLASAGAFGLLSYFAFVLSFLFVGLRLWQEIPQSHSWHRIFLVGSLSGQIVFHYSGLYIWNLGSNWLLTLFTLSLAICAILSERYARGFVSDDSSI